MSTTTTRPDRDRHGPTRPGPADHRHPRAARPVRGVQARRHRVLHCSSPPPPRAATRRASSTGSSAAWSFALAAALIVAAVRLGVGNRRTAVVTAGLLLVEIAFSFVKLFVYDEPEAVGFMAVDLVLLLALLALAARRQK